MMAFLQALFAAFLSFFGKRIDRKDTVSDAEDDGTAAAAGDAFDDWMQSVGIKEGDQVRPK